MRSSFDLKAEGNTMSDTIPGIKEGHGFGSSESDEPASVLMVEK